MRPFSALPAVASIVLLASCGDGPTGGTGTPPTPPSGGGKTTLSADTLRINTLGGTATVVATSGSQSTSTPSLSAKTEARYLAETAVLSAEDLAAGRIVARGPGRAVLEVAAFGNAAVPLVVVVEPAQPAILSFVAPPSVGDGDTVAVRGFRLNAIPAAGVTVGGSPVRVLSADSANLRLEVPTQAAGACQGTGSVTVDFAGATVISPLKVVRKRAGEVSLGVGRAVRLTAEQVACLRLPAQAGAQYALTFFDARRVEAARTGNEGGLSGRVTYAVADRTVAASGVTASLNRFSSPAARSVASDFVVGRSSASAAESCITVNAPECRTTPWVQGERFVTRNPRNGDTASAIVHRVSARYVVASLVNDQPAELQRFLEFFDAGAASLSQVSDPMLQGVFGNTLPVTSPGSGQTMILAWTQGAAAGSVATTVVRFNSGWARPRSYIWWNLGNPAGTWQSTLGTLSHEAAHTFQAEYYFANMPSGPVAQFPTWAMEGSADLLGYEIVRTVLGIPADGNFDFAAAYAADGSAVDKAYASLALSANGDLVRGYQPVAVFLQDLIGERARRGEARSTALREVVLGAVEGWYGFDNAGTKRAGLTARMQAVLGAQWEPVGAVLAYGVSAALDEVPGAGEYQIEAFKSMGGRAGFSGGFRPIGALTGGQGATTTAEHAVGGVGYLTLSDNAVGGSYQVSASVPGVIWMLARMN